MKLLSDFLPILLFFIAFKIFGIYVATAAAIVTAIIQTLYLWLNERRIETMNMVTLLTLVVLGGATLLFHNEMFIKWKPTAINWALAVVFAVSQFLGPKPVIQRLMENNITLPAIVWQKINMSWVVFFVVLGAVNLYVVYFFDTDTWVNFKLFGILGATLVFAILQAVYLSKHIRARE